MPITRTITIEKKKTRRTRQVAFKRKPNPKGKHLVVVESPAKAKTIERILGPDYKVMASMGHLRDLPKRTMGVDIEWFHAGVRQLDGSGQCHQGSPESGEPVLRYPSGNGP